MYEMSIQICNLVYIVILQLIYFLKRKYNFLESKIYKGLLVLSTLVLTCDIANIYDSYNNLTVTITNILSKVYFVLLLLWSIVFFAYVMLSKTDKKYDNLRDLFHKNIFSKIFTIFNIILIILMLFINSGFSSTSMHYYGNSITYLYIIVTIECIFLLLSLLYTSRKLSSDKNWSILISIILFLSSFALQVFIPNVLLLSSGVSLVTIFIYFTLENPDIKYIQELNILKEKAEAANKAKTDFLASVSHEIRTPLNVIIGLSESILESNISNTMYEDVKNINQAGEILLEIINNILDITKVEEGKMVLINEPYNLGEVIGELSNIVKVSLSEKPIKFNVTVKGNIPSKIMGDKVKVHQILLNLLTNAVKYTKKGSITLNIDSKIVGNKVLLTFKVIDTGIGIKKSDYDKLFKKFERLDQGNKNIEGTGLGLVITKQLLNLMNGKISFESTYQKGSTFTVEIEQTIVDKKQLGDIKDYEITKKDVHERFDGSNYEILLVDDNVLNLKVAEKLLKAYKLKVTCVNSGLECLNITKNHKFDLIFLDHMMPDMDGIQTLYNLKKRAEGFDTPVIVLTANAIEGSKEMYLREGFVGYLSKPIDQKELDNILRKYLNISKNK